MRAGKDALDDDDWETASYEAKDKKMTMTFEQMSLKEGEKNKFKQRIIPKPNVPDSSGGSYVRQQPTTGKEHLSSVTANAATVNSHDAPIDPVLLSCLENPNEKMSLLKLEDRIVRFVKNSRDRELAFEPLTSYHRLLLYRLAQRFKLEHANPEITQGYSANEGLDSNGLRPVIIYRTPDASIPHTLFINLLSEKNQNGQSSAPAPKIMLRKRDPKKSSDSRTTAKKSGVHSQQRNEKTIEDREKAYAEARARIFGETKQDKVPLQKATTPSSSTTSSGGNQPNVQAKGPDGTLGFGAGRGQPTTKGKASESVSAALPLTGSARTSLAASAATDSLASSIPSQARAAHAPSRDSNHARQVQRHPSPNEDVATHLREDVSESYQTPLRAPIDTRSWKESKVTWRNRDEEMNDPDFARNYNMYKPNFAPFRSVGGGGDASAGPIGHARPPPSHHHHPSAAGGPGLLGVFPPPQPYAGAGGYYGQQRHHHPSMPLPPPPPPPPVGGVPGATSLGYLDRQSYGDEYHGGMMHHHPQGYHGNPSYPLHAHLHPPGGLMYDAMLDPGSRSTTRGGMLDGPRPPPETRQQLMPNKSYQENFPPLG